MDRLMAMQVFVSVAELGSQSAAAERLELSRPVVSRYLACLETWLGTRLMHRSTRKLSLTDAGQRCLEQCRLVLEQSTQLQAQTAVTSVPGGLLRITSSASFAQARLAALLAEFIQTWPLVKIDLQLQDKTVNLVEQGMDLALRISSEIDPNLIAHPLAPCPSMLCASQSYLQQYGRPQSVQELARHNCLTHSYFGKTMWQFAVDGQMQSVAVDGKLSANDAGCLQAAARAGAGIALLPTYLAAQDVRDGRLQHLLDWATPSTLQIYAVLASRRHLSPALKTLISFLRERLRTE